MKGYGKFLDGIEKIEKLFLAVTVAIMIVVITYQVILRYIFSASNSWSEELARYLFIYDVMIAAAIATRKNIHLQVDAFIGILKPKTRAIYTMIATLAGIVFLVFLFGYSLVLCQAAADNVSAGLKVPMSIPYACMPIGAVLMILTSIEVVLKQFAQIAQINRGEA
nr:TRAP transporter small permease [uncultured Anaerotignum sp.]